MGTRPKKSEYERTPLVGQQSVGSLRPRAPMIVAFGCLGVTGFILSNSFWAELPILIRTQPEGYKIAVYIIVSMQLANIVPMLYAGMNRHKHRDAGLVVWIYALLVSGFTVSLLIGFFHEHTVVIHGKSRSVVLLSLALLSACVSNTSNVVYYPFVGRYSQYFTSALSTGGGLGGLISGVMGMLQNSGGEHPRFSITAYFTFVACVFMAAIGAVSYIIVHGDAFLTLAQTRDVESSEYEQLRGAPVSPERGAEQATLQEGDGSRKRRVANGPVFHWYMPSIVVFLLQQALFGSLAYGLIPSVSPIMVSGYETPLKALMWANVLGMVTDPIGRALTGYKRLYAYWLLTPSAVGLAAVLVSCAVMAPTPPLSAWSLGYVLPVGCYALFQLLTGFTITELFYSIRNVTGDANAELAFRWGGLSIQLGALLGTFIGYYLVIVGKWITP